jgi:desulfoferrodoxin (superoxide reductase-like protein)
MGECREHYAAWVCVVKEVNTQRLARRDLEHGPPQAVFSSFKQMSITSIFCFKKGKKGNKNDSCDL